MPTFEGHNDSRGQTLIRCLGIERLVIKWTVCGFAIPRLVSHRRAVHHCQDCCWEGDRKEEKKNRKESKREERKWEGRRGTEGRKHKGGKEEGECVVWGRGEQPCSVLQVFSSPSLGSSPPPHLPHRGDLDSEECAPCSVSGENRGGRKTHFSTPPPRFEFAFLHRLDFPRDRPPRRNETI